MTMAWESGKAIAKDRVSGGGGRTRTSDTGLMRPLLCHLSYAAVSGPDEESYRLTGRESSQSRPRSGHCARNRAREGSSRSCPLEEACAAALLTWCRPDGNVLGQDADHDGVSA